MRCAVRDIIVLAAMFSLFAAGCSEPGEFETAEVQGKVVFNGQGVPNATIIFTPVSQPGAQKAGKSATGTTDEQGNFTLSTYAPNDGAVIGKHSVAMDQGDPANPRPGKIPPDLVVDVTEGPNEITIELVP